MKVETIFSIIESIAVVFASIVAYMGVNAWRKEAKWKREYELAEEVLALFYDAAERMKIIRSMFGFSSEGSTRKQSADETPEQTRILNDGYIGLERFEREKEPFLRLRALKFRFVVVFGEESGKPFSDLNKLVNKILMAYRRRERLSLEGLGMRQLSNAQLAQRWEQADQDDAIIFSGSNPDPIQEELDEIIRAIEEICMPIISAGR